MNPANTTPTSKEIKTYLLETIRHVMNIEFFLHQLRIGYEDPERPHDIVGPGNKFEWDVMKGFATQYRSPKPDFNLYMLPSLILHREQYHHRMWNTPEQNNSVSFGSDATEDSLKLGAVDTVCSYLEDRKYQGGIHTWDEIEQMVDTRFRPEKRFWAKKMIPEMKQIGSPDLTPINNLRYTPDFDLPQNIRIAIRLRIDETITMLKDEHGILL